MLQGFHPCIWEFIGQLQFLKYFHWIWLKCNHNRFPFSLHMDQKSVKESYGTTPHHTPQDWTHTQTWQTLGLKELTWLRGLSGSPSWLHIPHWAAWKETYIVLSSATRSGLIQRLTSLEKNKTSAESTCLSPLPPCSPPPLADTLAVMPVKTRRRRSRRSWKGVSQRLYHFMDVQRFHQSSAIKHFKLSLKHKQRATQIHCLLYIETR